MTAGDARTFTAGGARHGDLSALLDRLEAAAAAATPGPWELDPVALFASNDSGELLFDYRDVVLVEDHPDGVAQCTADGALIVAAVNALPTLIAELRAHQAAVQAVQELADRWDDDADAFESLKVGYGDDGLDEDARRCEERADQYRDAADRIRAAVAALDPKEQD